MQDQAFLHIDQVCDEFEHQWKTGAVPQLADWMERVASPDREQLAVELMRVDVEYRLQTGIPVPSLDRYAELTGVSAAKLLDGGDEPSRLLQRLMMQQPTERFSHVTPAAAPQNSHTAAAQTGHPDSQSLPRVIGGCEIRRLLGRGGMGVVYEAWQPELKRRVALKTLASVHLADPGARRQFEKEAMAGGRLQHSGIVPVYSAGEDGHTPYIVMEFVDGRTLEELCQSDSLTTRRAAEVVAEVADAVAFAHGAGVVHRDLKPSNILIDTQGHAKLVDFGLARLENHDFTVTATGMVVGTAAYMAPEQARGDSGAAATCDLYSLGAVLYRCLTGRPPFHATSRDEVIRQVLDVEPIRPRQLNREIDVELETICLRCLEKSPRGRLPSARVLGDELRRYLRGEPILSRPVGPVRRAVRWCGRHRMAAALAGSAVVLLLLLAIGLPFLLWQQGALQRSRERRDLAVANEAAERRNRELQESIAAANQAQAELKEYFSTVAEAGELRAARAPGWTWEVCELVRRASRSQIDEKDEFVLRSLLADALTTVDLFELPPFCEDIDVDAICVAPDGSRVFLPEIRGSPRCFIHEFVIESPGSVSTLAPFAISAGARFGMETNSTRLLSIVGRTFPNGVISPGFSTGCVSPDGRTLAVGTRNGDLWLWDVSKDPPSAVVHRFPEQELFEIVYSADGQSLFLLHDLPRTLRRINATTGEVIATKEDGAIRHVTWLPNDTILVSELATSFIRDATSLECIGKRMNTLIDLPHRPANSEILISRNDGHIELRDVRTLRAGRPFEADPSNLPGYWRLQSTDEGGIAAAVLGDDRLRIWDGVSGHIAVDVDALGSVTPVIGIDSQHKRLILSTGGVGRAFQLRGAGSDANGQVAANSDDEIISVIAPGATTVNNFALNAAGDEIAVLEYETTSVADRWDVHRIDLQTGETVSRWTFCPLHSDTLQAFPARNLGIAFSPTTNDVYVACGPPNGIFQLSDQGFLPLPDTMAPCVLNPPTRVMDAVAEFELEPLQNYDCDWVRLAVQMRIPRAFDPITERIRLTLENGDESVSVESTAYQVVRSGWYLVELGELPARHFAKSSRLTCELVSSEQSFTDRSVTDEDTDRIQVSSVFRFPQTTVDILNYSLGPIDFLADGTVVAVVDGAFVRTWSAEDHELIVSWSDVINDSPSLRAFAVSDDQILAGTRNANVFLMNRRGTDQLILGHLLDNIIESPITPTSAALSPDGRTAVLGRISGEVLLLDVAGQPARKRLTGLQMPHPVTAVAMSLDGTLLAAADRSGLLRLWSISDQGEGEWFEMSQLTNPARQIRFAPDGERLFILCENERGVRVLNLRTLRGEFAELGISQAPRPIVDSIPDPDEDLAPRNPRHSDLLRFVPLLFYVL